MPIPANQITVAEIHMNGLVTAAGSNNRVSNFSFYFRRTATTSPITKAAVETSFQANIALPILAALNLRIAQTSNTVRWVNDALDAPVFTSRATLGLVTGDSMPMHMAVFILMRTGLRGRSYRGSKHFFPLSESDTSIATADLLNAGSQALWATAIAAILAGFTDSNGNIWVPTILSRKLSKTRTNPTTVVTNDVTAILLNKRIGRMSRREVKSVY